MPIPIKCQCGASLKAADEHAGRKMKCPKCSQILVVPALPAADEEILDLALDDSSGIPNVAPPQVPPTANPNVQGQYPPGQPVPMQQPGMQQPYVHPQQQGGQIPPGQIPGQPYPAGQQPYPGQQPHPQQAYPQQGYPQQAPGYAGAAPAKKKSSGFFSFKTSALSLVITGSVIALIVGGFGIYLFVIYNSQRSETQNEQKYVYRDGKRVTVDSLKSLPKPPPPNARRQVAILNNFDSGKASLVNPNTASTESLNMADLIQLVEPSIVRINVQTSDGERVGSGFFIDKEGKIITNYHVVQGALKVTVSTADGKKTEALGYIADESEIDLVIVQIDPKKLDVVPIPIAKDLPRRGETVAAFGAPMGLSFSATEGTISGIRSGSEVREILNEMSEVDLYKDRLGYRVDVTWIQTTAAISGGNSGGALVNQKGELVGINTWQLPTGQNLNFASTADEVGKLFSNRNKGRMIKFNHRPPIKIHTGF